MNNKFDLLLAQINQLQAAVETISKNLLQVSHNQAEHDKRFDALEARLAEHDKRFDALEARLAEHDKRFEEHNQRLIAIEQRLDKVEQRLDKVEQRLDKVEQRLDKVEQRLDKLTVYVLDGGLREDLKDVFVTKEEFNQKMDQIISILDTHTQILKRLDQERIFTHQRITRLEEEVEKIKKHLNIS